MKRRLVSLLCFTKRFVVMLFTEKVKENDLKLIL